MFIEPSDKKERNEISVLLHLAFVQSIAQKCNVQLILSFVDDDLEVSKHWHKLLYQI